MIIHNKCLDNGETKYEKTVALLYKRNGGIGKLFIICKRKVTASDEIVTFQAERQVLCKKQDM